jgi:hypothetical protein
MLVDVPPKGASVLICCFSTANRPAGPGKAPAAGTCTRPLLGVTRVHKHLQEHQSNHNRALKACLCCTMHLCTLTMLPLAQIRSDCCGSKPLLGPVFRSV